MSCDISVFFFFGEGGRCPREQKEEKLSTDLTIEEHLPSNEIKLKVFKIKLKFDQNYLFLETEIRKSQQ